MLNLETLFLISILLASCGKSGGNQNDLRSREKNVSVPKTPESQDVELANLNLGQEQNFTVIETDGTNRKLKDYFSKNYLLILFDDDHCDDCVKNLAEQIQGQFETSKSGKNCDFLVLTSRDQFSDKSTKKYLSYLKGIHASPMSIIKRFKQTDLSSNTAIAIDRSGNKVNTSSNAGDFEKLCK